MSVLERVPAVGINTDFIKDRPLALVLESGVTGSTDTISLGDGTPLISVERDLSSARHRICFIDAQSNQKLFEMVKQRFKYEYYAEHPDGNGKNLFDIHIESAFVGGPTAHIEFPNVANGGSMTHFEYKVHTLDKVSTILWEGQPVAEVERQSLGKDCSIRVAPCVDPLPVIATLMAITDRARKNHTVGMGAAGFGGAALGGGGGGS